ncbi:MAG TPA: cyclodeaminase/cyclohydrolase family protein, partial [Firmicutes bacterium]|nr:cyclodeaminase/cyclohydrolase family protein [Bacillota bacterium]
LASKAPVPGGGGAAALGGAIGMALAGMVGNLTVGKKKYAAVEGEVKGLLDKSRLIMEDLQALVDKDAEVFAPLAKAYSLPGNTPEEREYKQKVLEECSKAASTVPLKIMRKCLEGIRIQARMGQIGSRLALSDVGCGVAFLKAALISGSLNVIINLNSIKDEAYIDTINKEMSSMLEEGVKLADATLEYVQGKLQG